MGVKIGIGLFTGQVMPGSERTFVQEYREILDLVRLAETLGFDSAWVSEHHGAGDGYMPSLLAVLAGFAAATSHIELGTGVVLTPFHHPIRLAEDAATVDLISGGRLLLGLGLGWREEEFRMFGMPVAERVPRTAEAVEILRRAWTGRRFSFDGRVFHFDEVQVTPPPARSGGIPIVLGGSVEPAIRRAGRIGDGYLRTRGGGVDRMRQDLRIAETAAREAGRDVGRFWFGQLQSALAWDDGDPWEVIRDGARHHIGVYSGWAEGSDTPGRDFFLGDVPDDALRHVVAAGTSEEVARRLRPIVDEFGERPGGFTLVVRLHYPGMPFDVAARAVETFAERVLPALKGA